MQNKLTNEYDSDYGHDDGGETARQKARAQAATCFRSIRDARTVHCVEQRAPLSTEELREVYEAGDANESAEDCMRRAMWFGRLWDAL